MDASNEGHEHRWDPEPVEETLAGARALTVSAADELMRAGWEQVAQVAGIPRRRWARHHPVGAGPLVAIVDGEPAFDALAWSRLASLVPGAVALPTRTAAALGVAPGELRPPGRPPLRVVDLLRARRMRRRLRRAERRLDADLAILRERVHAQLDAALAPGDDGTPLDRLPPYALAARLQLVLAAGRGWREAAVVELANGAALAHLLRLLMEGGESPGAALLELARLGRCGAPAIPDHLLELERIGALGEPERSEQLESWLDGLGGWHSLRDLLLEAPPLRADPAAVRALATAAPLAPRVPSATDPPDSLADAVQRVRGLTRQREQAGQLRADLHAALRAVAHALAARLAGDGVLPRADAAFDLTLEELLRAARGVATAVAPLAIAPAAGTPASDDASFVEQLRGIPASAGTATGRVVVLDEPALHADVDGAVLVCRMTDPGWLPLLLRCGALVVERGGPLSHAAIVARELALPAVVGVRDARSAGRAAGSASVDGTRGEVTFHRR